MKIYLSGPMSGYPEYNFPAFRAAAKRNDAQEIVIFQEYSRDKDKLTLDELRLKYGDEYLGLTDLSLHRSSKPTT